MNKTMNAMKTLRVKWMLSLFFLMSGWIAVNGQQNSIQVPGDNFSLEGALELFKKSASPEEFERMLNSAGSKVNNLDLNGDGDIDYIKVIDRNEGAVHAFILQAIVSETESQDVAVIELEKLANGKAVLQITGDADIYGIETIIEPTEEVRINAGTSTARSVVNVWAWPSVQYVYSPYYSSLWISPWEWSMRPVWWSPWRPVSYYEYSPWWSSYRPYYSACYTHRVVYAQHLYRPYRSTSIVVYNRHHDQITHYRSRHDSDDNRGRRDNDNRMSGRQNNNDDHRNADTNGRQRSVEGQNRNSNPSGRSSSNDWSQREDYSQKRSAATRDESFSRDRSSSRNRSITDLNRTPSVSQQNSNGFQKQESRNWSRPDNNTGSRQAGSRLSYDTRGTQRSVIQPSNNGSSGSRSIQRSGNDGGGNKSSGQKRGRD